jgi:hypothetical protein
LTRAGDLIKPVGTIFIIQWMGSDLRDQHPGFFSNPQCSLWLTDPLGVFSDGL